MIYDYETVSEAVNDLKKRGYTADLSMEAERECLVCQGSATNCHRKILPLMKCTALKE